MMFKKNILSACLGFFLAATTRHCFAAQNEEVQTKPRSYFEQMKTVQAAEDTRNRAAYHAYFLEEFAKFFPKGDRRYPTIARLSEQCLMQKDSAACIELEQTTDEILRQAQSRCAHEGIEPIFAVAKELCAINKLSKGGEHNAQMASDKARLAKEMRSLIVSNECHLCSSMADFEELLLSEHYSRKPFYTDEANMNRYALLLLRSYKTIASRNRWHHGTLMNVPKAPFLIIDQIVQKMKSLHALEKMFPHLEDGHYRLTSHSVECASDDLHHDDFMSSREKPHFKERYPKPKSRVQEHS